VINPIRTLSLIFAAGLALAACTPGLTPPPRPLPPSVHDKFDPMIAADGTVLPLHRTLPDGKPRAVIVALHGFNDYSNAFTDAARFFAGSKIATFAYDQRGFGEAPDRGYWDGVPAMVSDANTAVALARKQFPGVPVYLMGESMGGALAMVATTGPHPVAVDGVILVAPAVWSRPTMNVFERVGLWLASHTVPWLGVSGGGLGIVPSDNIEMLKKLGRDPLVIKSTLVGTLHGLVDLMDAAYATAPHLTKPTLLLYGERDRIVPPGATCSMFEHLPTRAAADRTWRTVLYPAGYHMLLRDLQGERVMSDIVAWVLDRGAPLPSENEVLQPGSQGSMLARVRALPLCEKALGRAS
jgi:alpha-beta hydrolase superfamily lysophospholipase